MALPKPAWDRRTNCWLWRGAKQSRGYGAIKLGGVVYLVHRVSWALHRGRWPEVGMEVHHTCFQRLCFNPAHLQEVTKEENAWNWQLQEAPF